MARDTYSDDHTIKMVGDTQTLTVDQNLNVLGDLDVGGSITATYDTLDVVGDVYIGGSLVVENNITAGDYRFENDVQIMEIIPMNVFQSLIDLSDSDVSDNTFFQKASVQYGTRMSDTYLPTFGGGGSPFIAVPIDPYLRHLAEVDSIGIWAITSFAGSDSDITVELQALSLTVSDNTWTTLASDTQTVGTGVDRIALEFDMNVIPDILNASYQIVISNDGNSDAFGLIRVAVLSKDTNVAQLLGKFP